MQEIHSIATGGGGGGGGSRFFGGGDRRLRPHQNNLQNSNQALKCPRCDSLNTKFCYYNNYNLSQPRHFCKNCRRYWTKGGVLRNVPVGGGCRKSKRSSKPKTSSSSSEISALPTQTPTPTPELNHKSNSHTSSESSSLTATAATEALSAPKALNSDSNNNNNADLEMNALEQGAGDCGIFSEIANFTSLITSSNEPLPFGFGTSNGIPEASSFQWQNQKVMTVTGDQPRHRNEEEMKLPESVGTGAVGSLLDQTVDFSALHSKTSNGGFGSLDWHGDGSADHQGLFDLPNTVDQTYWTNTHWSDPDNSSLFHLP